ncbi:MAG TPA: VTT domain-containing protein [Burkholderiales bacterium]|nr:VTT domain-containing protein [Burkholderiales bacterium]
MRAEFIPAHSAPATTPDSLFRIGANCGAVARADRAAFFVDAADYFEAFAAAAERAERSLVILAWDFDSRTRLRCDDRGARRDTLGEFLNRLARRRRKLQIHVLDWDYPMIFGRNREFPPLYGLAWKPHRRVHFRYDDSHPLAGSHHQKIVVIDECFAFVGGLDLTARRWDTPEHRPSDPRRIAFGKPYPPFHDLMCAVDGAAARELAAIARRRWRIATGADLPPAEPLAHDRWPPGLRPDLTDARVAIACTAPAVNGAPGIRHVEQLYLDMIARARRHIFIENQYFTSRRIGAALGARLADPDGPEIVLITRLLSHGWLEEATMHVLRTRLVENLRAADRNGRFQVYYPHIEGLAAGTCIDVHSKLMIVDDEWLRIGSSNLSNRSMRVDTECDLVIEAGGERRAADAIRAFRDRILAEHLGAKAADVADAIGRVGSIRGAIAALGTPARTLRTLSDLPKWSETALQAAAIADLEQPVSLERLVEQFDPDTRVRRVLPMWLAVFAVALAVAALAASWRYTPLAEWVAPENVIAWVESFARAWWAPLAIVLAYTPACVVMFPRPVITLAAVLAFGPWLGFGYAMGGILLSALAGHLVGQHVGRDALRRIAGRKLNRLSKALRRRGILAVTAVRLVPLAPFVIESLVAGAIHIRRWDFMVGTFLGMLPGVLAATIFGDQLETALHDPARVNYWVVAGVLIFFAVLTVAVRRWLARQSQGTASPSRAG